MKIFPVILLALISASAFSQSSSRFAITRSVVANGGTTFSSSARFQLGSTIAQPVAAVPSSARFAIQGGFWIRPAPVLFAPAKIGTNYVVSIQSELGETYTVQYLNSLSAVNWSNLPSVTGNGSVLTVSNSTTGSANRFFRLIQQ